VYDLYQPFCHYVFGLSLAPWKKSQDELTFLFALACSAVMYL